MRDHDGLKHARKLMDFDVEIDETRHRAGSDDGDLYCPNGQRNRLSPNCLSSSPQGLKGWCSARGMTVRATGGNGVLAMVTRLLSLSFLESALVISASMCSYTSVLTSSRPMPQYQLWNRPGERGEQFTLATQPLWWGKRGWRRRCRSRTAV